MFEEVSKRIRADRLSLLLVATLVAILAAACSAPGTVTSVSVMAPPTLLVGRTAQATADVVVTGAASTAVTWSSSDDEVATVDASGLVRAVGEGNVTITATSQANPSQSDAADIEVSSALRDATVLYYVDDVVGADDALAALHEAAATFDAVVVETDNASFVNDLADMNPDLVVYLRQDSGGIPDDAEAALLTWVENGGALVFTSWDIGVSDVDTQLASMEAAFTGEENYVSMEIEHPILAAGLSSSTIPITDEYWGTFSMGLEALGDGVELAHFYDLTPELTTDAALVSGNDGRTMVLGFLSDTVENEDDGIRLLRNVFEYVLLATLP
ncbi:MAG: Ig-like domain-containing protein [Trueperaceae bacterium]|nr:Ig-like domain-containing protein [Trueperaceae bacterium]